jgi:hopanoid biosynthesis associated radical SAM protein HpnH
VGVPLRQQLTVGSYLIKQKLKGVKKYPLVLMLEPLFRCNLACAGCGKIDYSDDILDKRLSFEECMQAVDECDAPMVSIPGGEPLIHKEMPQIVEGIIARKKFVYLCTNALLLKKRIDDYKPSPYLTFSIHLDGMQERHDTSVCQEGVFERAVEAIKLALEKGFRVTVNCTLFQGENAQEVADFLDYAMELGVEGVTIAPGFSYEHAPQQDVFIKGSDVKDLFRGIFKIGKKRNWKLNHSSLYLDFLAVTKTTIVRHGAIRPVTYSAGKNRVTYWLMRVMFQVFRSFWIPRLGKNTVLLIILNVQAAWRIAVMKQRLLKIC